MAAIAAAADIAARRESQALHRASTVDIHESYRSPGATIPKPLIHLPSMGSVEADVAAEERFSALHDMDIMENGYAEKSQYKDHDNDNSLLRMIHQIIGQLPAIAIASVLNFMIGIPFGASYFPTDLKLAGKEVLGLRMFLFSTMVAQFVFTFKSKFENGIGLQMVEVCVYV